ncbi:MAG: hydantoin racemase [Anaerolineae bacterium]|nr:hydantoin racemase [Anaerolineae bacterium]
MTKILYANPVGSKSFDADTVRLIDAIKSPGYEPVVRALKEGPPHLEYHTYEHEALGGLLQLFVDAEAEGCAAGIIGCFYDGGLRELREMVRMPVVGMAEAALAVAATMGHKFSIIVGRRKWIPKMEDNAVMYGHGRRLASLRSVNMGIPDVEADPQAFFDACIREGRKAVEEDGAEVIVLSEIATPAFWEQARQELDAPIVDPGVACWKWAEMVASMYEKVGYSHSKIGGFEAPPVRVHG